jgi:glycosyltransferase involved in cell wall biosynthesis
MMMIISSLLYLPIFFKFGIHSQVVDAKPLLKEALQAEVGLPVDRNIPVIGFIGRLEEQKGSDILVAAIPHFIRENVQIIVLVSIRIGFRRKKKKYQDWNLFYSHTQKTDLYFIVSCFLVYILSGNWQATDGEAA